MTLFVCLVVAGAAVALSIRQFPAVSSDAEASQIQYSYELSRGELDGSSYDPPLYHAITGAGATVLRAITPIESFISAARSTGIVWLTAGMFLSWLLLVELGVSIFTARVTLVALGLIPVVVHVSATVGNDAASLLAGAAVAIAALRHVKGRDPSWMVVAASLVAALLDPSFVCSAIFASLLLLVHANRERGRGRAWRSTAAALALPLVFVVVVVGWNTTSPGPMPSNDRAAVPGVDDTVADAPDPTSEDEASSGGGLLADAAALIPVTETPSRVPQAGSALVEPWLDLTSLMVAGSPFCIWLIARRDDEVTRFGGVVVSSLFLGALGIVAVNELRAGTTITSVQPTDGLALLPVAIACSAILVDRTRIGRLGAAVVVGVGGTLLLGDVGGLW